MDISYVTIATSDKNGDPWNTPVFTAYDDNYNFYWSSHSESNHSKNIAANGKGFLVIYNSKANEGEGMGLYIRARIEEFVNESDVIAALDLLGQRRGKPFGNSSKFINDGPQHIHKAIPLEAWINDADQDSDGDFIRDYRIEVKL